MSNNEKNRDCGCGWFCVFILILTAVILLAFFITNTITFVDNDVLVEHTCIVTRVEYPITFPTVGDTEFWENCDCGRRCTAWGPVVNIYTNASTLIAHETTTQKSLGYTFFNESCPHGEDVRFTHIYMDDAAAIAERYINSTIPCYFTEPNSNVYLTKIDNLESFVGLTSAFGFIIVVIMIIIIRSFRKNDDCCISSA